MILHAAIRKIEGLECIDPKSLSTLRDDAVKKANKIDEKLLRYANDNPVVRFAAFELKEVTYVPE